MRVEIHITESPGDRSLGRFLFGRFYWSAFSYDHGLRNGLARTYPAAQRKAQAAARKLVAGAREIRTEYTYETE